MKVKPFRALRPVRDKVHLVATRPFYAYKKNVLKAKMQSNPFSFLHIINPDFDILEEEASALSRSDKYQLVHQQYQNFIEDGVLVRDVAPSMYIYKQSHLGNEYIGVIAATSVEDYNHNKVMKHEATLTSREEMFTDYLDTVGYNAEPVLLSHSPSSELDAIFEKITTQRPEYEFTTTDYIKHEIWLSSQEECDQLIGIFSRIGVSYIADGHHRCASSAALNQKRTKEDRSSNNDGFFLSYLIDETKLKVYEYNRLVRIKDLAIHADLLERLKVNFEVEELSDIRKPLIEHEIVMLYNDNPYSLICKKNIIHADHPIKSLDAEILTEYVLHPILNISDLKTDKNIGFISGTESIDKLKKKMNKGSYNLAFLLFPVTIDQVKKVADNQMIMPPKSTWIEPKMRSGLTVYCLNE